MQCAAGTVCEPSGFTDDFRVQFDGSGGTSTGTADASMDSISMLLVFAVLCLYL